MIIDDDVQIGNLEQEVLEREGYICNRAYSGMEAVLLLEKGRPDLVLLDLMLPGISGEEVLRRIKDIPTIVVSAKIGIDDKVSMLTDGAVMRQLDKNALRRVFDNLIGNAVKYSDGNLTITLTGSGEISFTNTADTLNQLSVGRLFDRFYTVESAGRSTGIGLSVAKLLTEKMGGGICAELHDGKLTISVRFDR